MLMSVIARQSEFIAMPELAGARVVVTGMTSELGFDIARAFADHGARLIIQSPDDTPEMTELAAVLAENCSEIRLFNDPFRSDDDATRLMQNAANEFGGLDAVINLVSVEARDVELLDTAEDVETLVSKTLRLPLRLTDVAANRMRLTLIQGSILTVVRIADGAGGRGLMLGDVLRTRLAEMTRGLAQDWAQHGIRVNAVGPRSSIAALGGHPASVSDADLAAVALQLASSKGRSVSGHLLDAEGAARRWC